MQATGRSGTISTVFEIREEPNELWARMDPLQLFVVLEVLQRRNKVVVIKNDQNMEETGIKFL